MNSEALRLLEKIKNAIAAFNNTRPYTDYHMAIAAIQMDIAALRALLSAQEPTGWQPDSLLPCDVMVAPKTIIRRGCKFSTLLTCIKTRYRAPEDVRSFGELAKQEAK